MSAIPDNERDSFRRTVAMAAMHAMIGISWRATAQRDTDNADLVHPYHVASSAVGFADHLIEALEREREPTPAADVDAEPVPESEQSTAEE